MLTTFALAASFAAAEFLSLAPTPPMGWNSWDCFATTVTETQTKAQTDVMAAKLRVLGWQYVVVDIQWYEPDAKGFDYRAGAKLTLDSHGRLQPAPNRFPSAASRAGFKSLAQYVHRKGLKFGLHLMRGIPRQAITQNCSILGTHYHARDIADPTSTCPWNTDMYGVDMDKPGAQEYYNSVFSMLAGWGVDFVKVDDLSQPYHQEEIDGIRRAIDHSGRPMVLSLSPGETRLNAASHVMNHANMWRISDDFWDDWSALRSQFERCRKWSPFVGSGHWPDADMLPLGKVRFGERTHFTPDEQVTMLTLWAMFRSPLMLGCDLTTLDAPTLALITNPEWIAVNQHSVGGQEVARDANSVIWSAHDSASAAIYVALFNLSDQPQKLGVDLRQVGADIQDSEPGETHQSGKVKVRDLWQRKDLSEVTQRVDSQVPAHGAVLLRLSPLP